jgi:WD40 repeat protein
VRLPRFRFTALVILLLGIIAALAAALTVERQRRVQAERALRAERDREIERVGGGPFTIGVVTGGCEQPPLIGFTPAGDALLVVERGEDRRVRCWEFAAARFREPPPPPLPEELWGSPVLSPDARLMAVRDRRTVGAGIRLRIVDLVGGQIRAAYEPPDRYPRYALAFSPDGATLATADPSDGEVELIDATTGRLRSSIKLGEPERGILLLTFSPDGETIALGGESGVVVLLDTGTGRERGRFHRERDGAGDLPLPRVDALSFSPDGRLLAEVRDNQVLVREVATGRELFRDETPPSGFASHTWIAGFTPDGSHLVRASRQGLVRLLAVPSGRLDGTLMMFPTKAPKEAVVDLKLSPDRRVLAGSLERGAVIAWDLASLVRASNTRPARARNSATPQL